MTKRRNVLLAGFLWGAAARAARAATPAATEGDPLGSPQWPGLRREYTQDAPLRFTDAVQVRTPAFADDALNVPLQIDARALQAVGGGITRMVVIADRNPIREVLAFEPLQALHQDGNDVARGYRADDAAHRKTSPNEQWMRC